MSKHTCPIVAATTTNCIEYQNVSAAFATDAAYLVAASALIAAAISQQHAREYHDAAWDRLARLIGVA